MRLVATGFCMGIAHIIPGVSGGTIAFIFGIYEDLIAALKSFDTKFLKFLFKFKIKELLEYVPWQFMTAILLGTLGAIFSLSKLMTWLLVNKPVQINAFFFGLIMATAPIIGRNIKKWNLTTGFLGVLSAIGMYFLVGMIPIQTPNALWFLFLSGALAISTMILPGISGSFVLLLIGKYQYIIEAVSNRDFGILFAVALGCIVGILAFVRLLSWLFNRFHDQTVIILTGLVLGSLRKIWPWKETLQSMTTHKGKIIPIEQINTLPRELNLEVMQAIFLVIVGFLIAWFLGKSSPKEGIKAD